MMQKDELRKKILSLNKWFTFNEILEEFHTDKKLLKQSIRQLEKEGQLISKFKDNKKFFSPVSLAEKKEKKSNFFISRFANFFMIFLLVFFIISFFIFSLSKSFSWDEFEHLNASWLVANGNQPYTDFFEHHTPLLWYFFSVFFILFGDNTLLFYVFRFMSFIVLLLCALVFYFILRELDLDKMISFFGVILLLFNPIFLFTGFTIRPDQFSLLFALISILFFLKKKEKKLFFYLSGIFLGISFLFLQKAVFLFVPLIVFLLFREKSLKDSLVYSELFFLPILTFVLFFFSNALSEFLFYNFNFNLLYNEFWSLTRPLGTNFMMHLNMIFSESPFLVIALPFSVIYLFLKKRLFKGINFLFVLFALFFIYNSFTYADLGGQYFLFIIPFCVFFILLALNDFIDYLSERYLNRNLWLIVFSVIMVVPFIFNVSDDLINLDRSGFDDLVKVNQYVLDNSSKEDLVYQNTFPRIIFRKTIFSNFFCTACNNVIGHYDINVTRAITTNDIFSAKPKFIYFRPDLEMNYAMEKYGYEKTDFNLLYIRK